MINWWVQLAENTNNPISPDKIILPNPVEIEFLLELVSGFVSQLTPSSPLLSQPFVLTQKVGLSMGSPNPGGPQDIPEVNFGYQGATARLTRSDCTSSSHPTWALPTNRTILQTSVVLAPLLAAQCHIHLLCQHQQPFIQWAVSGAQWTYSTMGVPATSAAWPSSGLPARPNAP